MRYLSEAQMLAVHDLQILRFGGTPGIRDRGLLRSALEMPGQEVFGQELHASVHEKAAAYLYHLSRNHPFLDGNKRTAAAAMLIFLKLNGHDVHATQEELFSLTLETAQGKRSKDDIARWLQHHGSTLGTPRPGKPAGAEEGT